MIQSPQIPKLTQALLDRHIPSAKPSTFQKGIRMVGRTLNATINSLNFFKWSFSWSHIFCKKHKNKDMQAFHRDRLLYSKETNARPCAVKEAKRAKWWELLFLPFPLNCRRKTLNIRLRRREWQQTKRSICNLNSREADPEPWCQKQLLRPTTRLFRDKSAHPKEMRCVAHFKIRRAEYYILYKFLSESQKCIIYIKEKRENDYKS